MFTIINPDLQTLNVHILKGNGDLYKCIHFKMYIFSKKKKKDDKNNITLM